MSNFPRIAVLVATGPERSNGVFADRIPAPMLPLVDRPFLQHVVEHLVDLHVERFHFVLSRHPQTVESYFGDGRRWGSQFFYHLAQDPDRPYEILRLEPFWERPAWFVLASGEVLVFDLPSPGLDPSEAPWVMTKDGQWTGWAYLHASHIAHLWLHATAAEMEEQICRLAREARQLCECSRILSVESDQQMLRAQGTVLRGDFPELVLYGREMQAGLRCCRNAHLDATVRIVPPVFLNPDCRVGPHCTLGPNVVVGREALIAGKTTAVESTIFDHSYVGESLTLNQTLVDGSRMHHVRLGTEFAIADDLILDDLGQGRLAPFLRSELSRFGGLLLLAALWPLLLAVFLVLWVKGRRPVLHRTQVVRLPVNERSLRWQTMSMASFAPAAPQDCKSMLHHFLYYFLPGLPHVVRRELHLVGVPPRTVQQMASLGSGWRRVYSQTKPGLVSEALVSLHEYSDSSSMEAAEQFYASRISLWRDAALLARYGCGVIAEWMASVWPFHRKHSAPPAPRVP